MVRERLFLFGKKERRKNETRRIEETNYRIRVYLEDSVFNFQDFLNIYCNAFLLFLLHRFFRQSLKRLLSREIEAKRPPQWIVFDSGTYCTFVQLSDITYSYRKEYLKLFFKSNASVVCIKVSLYRKGISAIIRIIFITVY